jgi:O-antigen biosynthesis protein WbqP
VLLLSYHKDAKLKRFFDFVIAFILFVVLFVPMILVALLVKLTSKGSALYWSDRIGRENHAFKMPKFRSMRIETPVVAYFFLIVGFSMQVGAFSESDLKKATESCI